MKSPGVQLNAMQCDIKVEFMIVIDFLMSFDIEDMNMELFVHDCNVAIIVSSISLF